MRYHWSVSADEIFSAEKNSLWKICISYQCFPTCPGRVCHVQPTSHAQWQSLHRLTLLMEENAGLTDLQEAPVQGGDEERGSWCGRWKEMSPTARRSSRRGTGWDSLQFSWLVLSMMKVASSRTVLENWLQSNCPGESTFISLMFKVPSCRNWIQMPSSPINSSSCLASPVCPASPTFGLNHQASPKLARCELLTNGLKPLWRTCEHAGPLPSLPLPPLSLSECLALWSWTPTMLDLGHPLWAGLSFLNQESWWIFQSLLPC